MRAMLKAAAAVALMGSASSALAADLPARLPVKAPVVAPIVYNWTGFYVGGNGGYSWGRSPTDIVGTSTVRTRTFRGFALPNPTLLSDNTVAAAFAGSGTSNIDGGVAGGQVGYNWQVDRYWVLGIETDFQWTGQRGSNQFCLTAGCPAGTFVTNVDTKLQWFGTLRGRAGWLIDPRVMLYATGGLAYGEVKVDYSSGILGTPLAGGSASSTRVGWTAGAGVEGALWSNWTIKAEYLYVDLGSVSTGGLAGTSTAILADTPTPAITTVIDTTVAANSSVRMRDNIFRLGLNYRFGPEPVVARY